MAILTLVPTLAGDADGRPYYPSQLLNAGVRYRYFSGAGVTITPIQALVTGSRHIIVGGRITADAACTIVISATAAIDNIEFVAAGTANMPRGLECPESQQLAITNPDAATVVGWIAWATVTNGMSLPLTGLF